MVHRRIPPVEARKTRYELVKSRSMQVQVDRVFKPVEGQPEVPLQDHRFGRVKHLMEQGIDPGVLRAVVMDHVGSHPEAIESLGLLTAMRRLTDAIRVAAS